MKDTSMSEHTVLTSALTENLVYEITKALTLPQMYDASKSLQQV